VDTLTERLERLAELQKKNVEPLQQLGGSAFVAFERMARKNYELMGDMVEYAVAQSRGSIEQSSPQDLYERQMSEARAFAERMSERVAEYLALAEQMRGEMTSDALDGQIDAMTETTGGSAKEVSGAAKPARKVAAKKSGAAGKTASTAKKAGAKRVSSKKTGSKKAGSKKAGSKKAGSKKAGSKKAGSKKAGSKKAGSKKTGSKKTGSKKKSSARKTSSK